jgi:hypothetical protein
MRSSKRDKAVLQTCDEPVGTRIFEQLGLDFFSLHNYSGTPLKGNRKYEPGTF